MAALPHGQSIIHRDLTPGNVMPGRTGSGKSRATPQLRITVETAEAFGILAAKLRRTGRDPHVRINDLWLAAQAIQRDFRLLTSNARDFADIPGLQIVVLKLP